MQQLSCDNFCLLYQANHNRHNFRVYCLTSAMFGQQVQQTVEDTFSSFDCPLWRNHRDRRIWSRCRTIRVTGVWHRFCSNCIYRIFALLTGTAGRSAVDCFPGNCWSFQCFARKEVDCRAVVRTGRLLEDCSSPVECCSVPGRRHCARRPFVAARSHSFRSRWRWQTVRRQRWGTLANRSLGKLVGNWVALAAAAAPESASEWGGTEKGQTVYLRAV